MDEIDKKILSLLVENARIPLKQIAAQVFLSPPAVSARIERMERSGVITGYRASVSPEKLGYHIDEMAVAGGSAGHALAMLYAYRDAEVSPVPVKMVFGAVGPSCFYLEDWINMGVDPDHPQPVDPDTDYSGVAGLFYAMSGKEITADMFATGEYLERVKDISAAMWIDENSVPTVCAYGAWDRVQAFGASRRLDAALTEHHVPHEYIVFPHSGHGLQNDNKLYGVYMEKVTEYLETYMPIDCP